MSPKSQFIVILAASGLLVSPAFCQSPNQTPRNPRPGAAEAFADRVMAFDSNGDGQLSMDEVDPRYLGVFTQSDANSDGIVTREELIAMANARIAGQRPGGARPGGPAAEANEEISFHDAMEQAGQGLRGFRRSPMDGSSRTEDLRAVQAIQVGLLFAKARVDSVEMSEESKKIFGTDAAAHKVALRLTLIQMIMKTLEFESALVEGETDKAKEIFASIRELRGKAHDLFEPEEEEHEEEGAGDPDAGGREGRGGGGGGEG